MVLHWLASGDDGAVGDTQVDMHVIQPAMTLMTVPRLHNHMTGGNAIEETTEVRDTMRMSSSTPIGGPCRGR